MKRQSAEKARELIGEIESREGHLFNLEGEIDQVSFSLKTNRRLEVLDIPGFGFGTLKDDLVSFAKKKLREQIKALEKELADLK